MNEQMLEAALRMLLAGEVADLDEALIEAAADGDGEGELTQDVYLQAAVSFEDAGVLTTNRGLVLRFGDGAEFQVTLVRSK